MFKDDMFQKAQDVRGWNLRPDVLVHGSPCQDFSIAGRQKGADEGSETRSSLMWETISIIRNMGIWKPRVVIWENVKNVLSKHMKHNFDKYLSEMEKLGYVNAYQVLDAQEFGLPQRRQRVFTVSILGGPAFDFSKLEKKEMRPLSDFLDDDWADCHIVKAKSMLNSIGRKKGNFNGTLRVLDDEGPCDCITTAQDRCPNSGLVKLDNGKYRLLTEKECWKLMGFSDEDYQAAESVSGKKKEFKNGSLYKQAGNSMPVPILEAIFQQILKSPYLVKQPSVLKGIGQKGIGRATVISDCAMTITTRQDRCPAQVVQVADDLYRYLTEKECWRLMGFSDEDYEKAAEVNPKNGRFSMPMYKQAGNSMPVPVLEAIFKEVMKIAERNK